MANKMRWVKGDRNEILHPVASATEIEVGDLLWQDTTAKPVSAAADQGTETATQQLIHDTFLGVAMEPHPAGSGDRDVRIATTGCFEFDCADGSDREIGVAMGPNEASNGTTLLDQEVTFTTNSTPAVGRLVKRYATGVDTTALIEVCGMTRSGVVNIT
jgi:hypothetical protein